MLLVGRVPADPLGAQAEVTPVDGWSLAKNSKPSRLPTVQYVPADGRNATVLLTLFPAGRMGVSDAATLQEFHRKMCARYLPTPDAPVRSQALKLTAGQGVYASFEDPSLVGKPASKGDYKVATVAGLYLGQDVLIYATILCDEVGESAFSQALAILQSVKVNPRANEGVPLKSATAAPVSGDEFQVRPPAGFVATGLKPSSSPGYFSYAREDGVMLSGWLDQAVKFKGMRSFWAAEKAALETRLGIKIEKEAFKILNGWNVVSYEVRVEDLTQQNIRACRVQGGTWVDVHLSKTGAHASQSALESVLGEIKIVTVK